MPVFRYKSSVSPGRKGSRFLKTATPKKVVGFLKLKPYDKLDWVVEIKGDQVIVRVSKAENEDPYS